MLDALAKSFLAVCFDLPDEHDHGIGRAVPHLQWGSHLAHFFGSDDELRDVLVPISRPACGTMSDACGSQARRSIQNRLVPHCVWQFPTWTCASAPSRLKSQTATNGTQQAKSSGPMTSWTASCNANRTR